MTEFVGKVSKRKGRFTTFTSENNKFAIEADRFKRIILELAKNGISEQGINSTSVNYYDKEMITSLIVTPENPLVGNSIYRYDIKIRPDDDTTVCFLQRCIDKIVRERMHIDIIDFYDYLFENMFKIEVNNKYSEIEFINCLSDESISYKKELLKERLIEEVILEEDTCGGKMFRRSFSGHPTKCMVCAGRGDKLLAMTYKGKKTPFELCAGCSEDFLEEHCDGHNKDIVARQL